MNEVSPYLHGVGDYFKFHDGSDLNGDVEYIQISASCSHIDMSIVNMLVIGLYIVVFIIGVISNVLGFYVTNKTVETRNLYVINSIIADLCNLFSIPFLLIKIQFDESIVVHELCKFSTALATIARLASKLFTTVIAADRCTGIYYSLTLARTYRSPFVVKTVSTLIWTVSAIAKLLFVFNDDAIENSNILWNQEKPPDLNKTFTLYFFIVEFDLFLVVISLLHLMILRKFPTCTLWTLTLSSLASFIVCLLPYWISLLILITSPPTFCYTRNEIIFFMLARWMRYIKSVINPILSVFWFITFSPYTNNVTIDIRTNNAIIRPKISGHI